MVIVDQYEYLCEEEKRLKEDRERSRYWKRWYLTRQTMLVVTALMIVGVPTSPNGNGLPSEKITRKRCLGY